MSGNTSGVRYLNALKVQHFVGVSAADIAGQVNTWLQANAGSRSFVQLDFLGDYNPSTTVFAAFLVYTE